jgi:hypothetical protein
MPTMERNAINRADTSTLRELEESISKAIQKIRGDKENDICKFLPGDRGGYMHHFTMRKMKNVQPRELQQMIKKYILDSEQPIRVAPKPRAARGSRKRPDLITLSKDELDRLVCTLRNAGDTELAGKLSKKRSLAACKRQLIASIRQNQIRPEYWSAYIEACKAHGPDFGGHLESSPLGGAATLQANG